MLGMLTRSSSLLDLLGFAAVKVFKSGDLSGASGACT